MASKQRGRQSGKQELSGGQWAEGESGNRTGMPTIPADDGVVSAVVMRKVWGQSKMLDRGPTERQLRRWLEKDPKGFAEAIDKKLRADGEWEAVRAENERLRAEVAALQKAVPAAVEDVPDAGTEAALELVRRLLKEAGDG